MILFIALPIFSIVIQSLFTPHDAVIIITENCDPFGCKQATTIDQEATSELRKSEPLGKFVGLEIYKDRSHLAVNEIKEIWAESNNFRDFRDNVGNLPFYRAMAFTLTFTFTVTPLMLIFGFIIALAVNSLHQSLKGLTIFFSLLPMIVSPLIGSLVLFWMIDSRGIIGEGLQWVFEDPDLSLKASTGLTWVMLIVYGIWHAAPFSFVVFYAGLQTLPMDTIESAVSYTHLTLPTSIQV